MRASRAARCLRMKWRNSSVLKKALRALLLMASLTLLVLGLGDYGILRALVRFLCPSCVGLA